MMLAVTGSPDGMSTRAPLPTTAAMFVKDSGGIGLMALSVRSSAVMRVRAGMLVLATTTLVPSGLAGKRNGALARLAAAKNATTARTVPMMMYSRLRRPRPTRAEGALSGSIRGIALLAEQMVHFMIADHSTKNASTMTPMT